MAMITMTPLILGSKTAPTTTLNTAQTQTRTDAAPKLDEWRQIKIIHTTISLIIPTIIIMGMGMGMGMVMVMGMGMVMVMNTVSSAS